jgi:type IV pilus assembly protein PilW
MSDSRLSKKQAMKRLPNLPGLLDQKGFSLIELMVSLTIGLVIAVAAISAYLGAASAGKLSEAQSRMNEDAQAALNILAQQIRMAGNNPVQSNRANAAYRHNPIYTPYGTTTFTTTPANFSTSFIVRGCDGKFSNLSTTDITLDTLITCGTSALPDSIAINYEADRYNTTATAGGLPTDCLGNTLNSISAALITGATNTGNYYLADNRFYIGTTTVAIPNFTGPSTNTVVPSLYCKGNGGASPTSAQPLVENIEDLQFTYGTVVSTATTTAPTATTPTAAPVAGYLSADAISNPADAGLLALSLADRWGKVATVRICVITRSENPVVSDAASARYDDCAGNRNVSAPDLRLRRAYSTTVSLRNRKLWLP